MDTFVGALSFEDRSIGAIRSWMSGRTAGSVKLLDYQDRATPGRTARELRERNLLKVRDIASGVEIEVVPAQPYAFNGLQRVLARAHSSGGAVTIDVSCMTRPHVVACAEYLARAHAESWQVAYTLPDTYGTEGRVFSWSDSLLIPFGENQSLSNQGLALGLLLLGFEAGRISIALEELEADAGFMVLATNSLRPDFGRFVSRETARIEEYLEAVALVGQRAPKVAKHLGSSGWRKREVDVLDSAAGMFPIVSALVEAARETRSDDEQLPAPVVLYPFGPKLTVFASAYHLAAQFGEHSWMVYPVGRSHSVLYSTGCGETTMVEASRFSRFYSN